MGARRRTRCSKLLAALPLNPKPAALALPPTPQNVDPLLKLLAALAASADISDTQMTCGFERVKAGLGDEVIDFGAKAKAVFRCVWGWGQGH